MQPHIKGTVAVLLVLNLETLLKIGLKNRGTVINCEQLLFLAIILHLYCYCYINTFSRHNTKESDVEAILLF